MRAEIEGRICEAKPHPDYPINVVLISTNQTILQCGGKMSSSFGNYLTSLRKQKGLRLIALAHRIGIKPSDLHRIERGKMSPPSKEVLDKMVKELDIKDDVILDVFYGLAKKGKPVE